MKQFLTPVRLVGIGAGAILVIIIIALTIRTGRLARRVDELVAGVSTELDTQNQLTSALEANQRQATAHLSEVRSLLNLTPGSYRFPSAGASDDATAGPSDPAGETLRLFADALERLEADREMRALEASLAESAIVALRGAVAENANAGSAGRAASGEVEVRSDGRLRWRVSADGETLLSVAATRDGWQLRSATDTFVAITDVGAPDSARALDALQSEAAALITEVARQESQWQTARSAIDRALREGGIPGLVAERGLRIGTPQEDDDGYRIPFVTSLTNDEAFAVVVRRSPFTIAVDAAETTDLDEAVALTRERILRADARTNAQPETERSIVTIRELATNEDVQALLAARGLTMSTDLRESLDFFYFDLTTADGDRLGALAVQKQLGRIYLTDPFDVVITTLDRAGDDPYAALGLELFATDGPGDRSLPDEFPPGFEAGENRVDGTSILLIGTHETKADTIILVHLSPDREISMVSIPRDLWWQQRKLSYHNQIFGTPHLVDQVEAILARPIDGWVRIDMYAFIEVVDILGGIEVTLEEPLIDPTYRVREEGEWRTLNYAAGTHQLGGVEALRLARSRHTSNDFERAMRQQQILDALRQRLNELNAGSLDRVYQLMETVGDYVDSSFSVWELAQFYLAYRSAPIVNRTGMTFDNVLYNTWSNLYLQGLERSEVDESFFLGEWILLPRDDNWSVIPWFVEQNIQ